MSIDLLAPTVAENNNYFNVEYSNSPPVAEISIAAPSVDSEKILNLPEDNRREWDVLRSFIREREPDTAVMLLNLSKVEDQWNRWQKELPEVEIFYPIRVNDDPAILDFISHHDGSFDCVSRREMEVVLEIMKLKPNRLIFSHVYKRESDLEYGSHNGLNLICFDSESELIKIRAHKMPNTHLLILIRTASISSAHLLTRTEEDQSSVIPYGSGLVKFGADRSKWSSLLKLAKSFGLCVVGVKIESSGQYKEDIGSARVVFDLGIGLGFDMRILDLGSAFPDGPDPNDPNHQITFEEVAVKIKSALNELFLSQPNFRTIAEPGIFLSRRAMCLAVKVKTSNIFSRNLLLIVS